MNSNIEQIIKSMNPNELEKISKFVSSILTNKNESRITNLDYLIKSYIPKCPNNSEHNIKKNGHKNGTQRYYCKDCEKTWSISNNKIVSSSCLNYQQLKMLLKNMYDYKPLEEISKELNISKTSLFEIQIRIFYELNQVFKDTKLSGIIQIDEKYIRISFKGYKEENMPRKSRKSGCENLVSGISNDQLCVIVAIDSYDNILIKVAGNGPASTNMIEDALKNRISENSIIVTDSKSSYIKFAKENRLKHIQIPPDKHSYKGYHLNDVNEIMTEISAYIALKKGISAKHLQHHLNFILYRKMLKYTIEYLEINEKMYIDTIMLNISLRSNEVYSVDLPFDLDKYRIWCAEHDL